MLCTGSAASKNSHSNEPQSAALSPMRARIKVSQISGFQEEHRPLRYAMAMRTRASGTVSARASQICNARESTPPQSAAPTRATKATLPISAETWFTSCDSSCRRRRAASFALAWAVIGVAMGRTLP